jgi:hypothetical protein
MQILSSENRKLEIRETKIKAQRKKFGAQR